MLENVRLSFQGIWVTQNAFLPDDAGYYHRNCIDHLNCLHDQGNE